MERRSLTAVISTVTKQKNPISFGDRWRDLEAERSRLSKRRDDSKTKQRREAKVSKEIADYLMRTKLWRTCGYLSLIPTAPIVDDKRQTSARPDRIDTTCLAQ